MANLEIEIEQGILFGCKRVTATGFEFNAYLGIPYAKPPIGKLRFCDPQPPEPWIGKRDATFFRDINSQIDRTISKTSIGSEDCLYLNIYVPANTSNSESLPVMFWIHGGGFMAGSGNDDDFGPDYLIEKNIILVTINYRLGALGFLCLNTPDVPGNAGMKDQVLALRWVGKNISKFSGDPNNITIFGQSAGSASVSFLIVSPMAKGLFHRAIMESGTCLAEWSYQKHPEANIFTLMKSLGFDTQDKNEALNILKNIPAEDISRITCKPYSIMNRWIFSPTLESIYPNVEAFLPQTPLELIKNGNYNNVPCMLGFNSNEGYIFWVKDLCDQPILDKVDDLDNYIDNLLPKYLVDVAPEVIEKIKKFYVSKELTLKEVLVNIVNDLFSLIDYNILIKNMSKRSKSLYFYQFSIGRQNNMFKKFIEHSFNGACHGDELAYLFTQNNGSTVNLDDDDLNVVKLMTDLWTNFAKYGNPTPTLNDIITVKWEPVKEDRLNYLDIGDKLKIMSTLRPENVQFLEELFKIN